MGKIKDFFEMIKFIEKEDGYVKRKEVEKGFYYRTMGIGIIIIIIVFLIIISFIISK